MVGLIWLILGIFFVIKGAGWLVDGASSLARRLGISDLAIGLTVVAFGTSLPELTVNIFAAIGNQPAVAIGNVTGSNICNILLILGVTSLLAPIQVQQSTIRKEIPFCLFAAVLLFGMALDKGFFGSAENVISRIDGLILLALFVLFLIYVARMAREVLEPVHPDEHQSFTPTKAMVYILVGLVVLSIGGKLVVDGAVKLASAMGLSQGFIAVTLVAVGTSIPELATSAMAAYKNKCNIAVGNVIGSNIFNVFLILGAGSVIRPLPVPENLYLSIYTGIAAVVVLFLFVLINKNRTLGRWNGAVLLGMYVLYLILQPR
jgi:cation:H+ antiporter